MKIFDTAQLIAVIINSITRLIELLLGFRIILKLFGASQSSSFVSWIYETTSPLISPFVGMFPSPELPAGLVIEFSVLFALLVYSFGSYIAIELLETLEYYSNQRNEHVKKK